MDVTEEELHPLYLWVDSIPLSRPKKNIARDFADGVLVAEVVHQFVPRLVELHNYSGAHGLTQKLYNWDTLNQKVFRKMGFLVSKAEIEATANCEAGAVERILKLLRMKLEGKSPAASSYDEAGVEEDEVMSLRQQFTAKTIIGRKAQEPGPVQAGAQTQHFPLPRNPSAGAQVSLTATSPGASPCKAAKSPELRPVESRSGARLSSSRSMGSPHGSPGTRARMSRAASAKMTRREEDELAAREEDIRELQEVTKLMEDKVEKLEQLVRLKDVKIQSLLQKLQHAGLA
ncbi:hypothetical protein WJX74_008573 [Apatococcus lobatus]|uniref:Calponin-homology (CH) domain-containing protein n=1 Tax=Apatococcus lobatus TaxID=904363 RepID=A0AAW1RL36_9CHLO